MASDISSPKDVLQFVKPQVWYPQTEDFRFSIRNEVQLASSLQDVDVGSGFRDALVNLTQNARNEVCAHLANEDARDEDIIEALFKYRDALVLLADRKHSRFLLKIKTTWRGVLHKNQTCESLHHEFIVVCVAAARLYAIMAAQQYPIEAANSYRRGAGIITHGLDCSAFAGSHGFSLTEEGQAISNSCEHFRDSLLVAAQISCAAESSSLGVARDLRMAAALVENSALSLLSSEVPSWFEPEATSVLLGFYYLLESEVAELEKRYRPAQLLRVLAAHVLREVVIGSASWYSLLLPYLNDDKNACSTLHEALEWQHPRHEEFFAGKRKFSTLLSRKGQMVPPSLLVESIPFNATSREITTREVKLLAKKALGRTRKKAILVRKTPAWKRKTLGFTTNSDRLNEVTTVESWKYGIERITSAHHKMTVIKKCNASVPSFQTATNQDETSDAGLRNMREELLAGKPKTAKSKRRVSFIHGDEIAAPELSSPGSSDEARNIFSAAFVPRPTSAPVRAKSKPAPYYVEYNAFTREQKRVYRGGKPFLHLNELIPKVAREKCSLCEREFQVSNLTGVTTRRSIFKLRKNWGMFQSSVKLRAQILMDTKVRVCLFCNQFFSTPMNSKQCHNLQTAAEDLDIEKMILDSIRRMTQSTFLQLSPDERKGICALPSELEPLPRGVINLAVHKQALQSSTKDDITDSHALNAVDSNIFDIPSKTKVQENPWWEVDLGHLCSISSIRLWIPISSLRMMSIWVLAARQPFDASMTFQEVIEHADASRHYAFVNRILEWEPESVLGSESAHLRARYVRIQVSGEFSLELLQTQIFGLRLFGLERKGANRTLLSSSTNETGEEENRQSSTMKDRILQSLRSWNFDLPRSLADPSLFIASPLLHKQQKDFRSSDLSEVVEKRLNECTDAYQRQAQLKELTTQLEQAAKRQTLALLEKADSTRLYIEQMYQEGLRPEPQNLPSVAEWQMAKLRLCFEAGTRLSPKRKPYSASDGRIPAKDFGKYFKHPHNGFPFLSSCILLSPEWFEGNLLYRAAELMSNVGHVEQDGVDWIGFLVFLLEWRQLLQVQPKSRNENLPQMCQDQVNAKLTRSKSEQHVGSPSQRAKRRIALHEVWRHLSRETELPHRPGSAVQEECILCERHFKRSNLMKLNTKQAIVNLTQYICKKKYPRVFIDGDHIQNVAVEVFRTRTPSVCPTCFQFYVQQGSSANETSRKPLQLVKSIEDSITQEHTRRTIPVHKGRTAGLGIREICAQLGLELEHVREVLYNEHKVSWRDLTREEKIGHLAGARIQKWARWCLRKKRTRENALAKACTMLEQIRNRDVVAKDLIREMDDFLVQTGRDRELQRISSYHDFPKLHQISF